MGKHRFEVCVQCMTYNQKAYISDTMNGFCVQKTTFPYVCVIVDDASTDGEPDLIRDYLSEHFDLLSDASNVEETNEYSLIVARHHENINCYFAVLFLKYNHYRKKDKVPYLVRWIDDSAFLASCEGDDYWIDCNKLQKQVDEMKSDPNIGLCYTLSMVYLQEKSCFSDKLLAINGPESFEEFLLHEPAITLTAIYRVDLYKKYIEEIDPKSHRWLMGDTPLWLWFSLRSKVKRLDCVTAVYRVLKESSSHSENINEMLKFNKSALEIRLFFVNKFYCRNEALIRSVYDLYFRSNMYEACCKRKPFLYIKNLFKLEKIKRGDIISLVKLISGFKIV